MGDSHLSLKRDIFDTLASHLEEPEITVLIGARQVGKTTLLDQLEQDLLCKGIEQEDILRFNMDLEQDIERLSSQTEFLNLLKFNLGEKKKYIFVDEVQRIENAGKFFKGIYDQKLNLKFVLTGSSSLEIRSSVSESLAGRKRLFNIYPFSFREFLKAKDPKLIKIFDLEKEEIPKSIHADVLNLYQEYLVFGGYPKVVLSANVDDKVNELAEIYQSYIDKDIVGLLKVGDRVGFKDMLKVLAHQVGSTINYTSLANDTKLSVPTLHKYLDILNETFVAFPLSPYSTNINTEIKKSKKYYFYDNGMRNYILSNLDFWNQNLDKGALLENEIAKTLRVKIQANQSFHFWRTKSKAEVDFIIDAKNLIPYEVKQKYQFSRSYRSFMDSYKLSYGYLVNLEQAKLYNYDDYKIEAIFPWQI